jgi:hypothetical protein
MDEGQIVQYQNVSDFPLPPYADPIPPASIQGQRLADIYDVIRSLRREVDNPASHETILEMLSEDQSTLKAVATVLHQSGALLQHNPQTGALEALSVPPCPPPQLLPGYSSWIVAPSAAPGMDELPSYAAAAAATAW